MLVNNAGISLDLETPVTGTDVEVFRRTCETNVFGVVVSHCCPTTGRPVDCSPGTGTIAPW